MNDRIKLKVMGISYSPLQSGAFALIMAQEDGPYRIPIVIGSAEAQSIAIQLEGIKTPRPMTHDLIVAITGAFGIEMQEVRIYKFEDGIFSSEIVLSDGNREITIDSRTSDAIAIAVRTGAPIYTTEEILKQTGTILDEDEPGDENSPSDSNASAPKQEPASDLSVEQLQEKLNKAIADEDYEEAARIAAILKTKQ